MGKFKRTCIITALLCTTFVSQAFADMAVNSTNLAGVTILPAAESEDGSGSVKYADGTEEKIGEDYTALFINGSMIKDSKLVISNDRTLAPVRLISEYFGADVKWDEAERKVTISDKDSEISLYIGKNEFEHNGEASTMDVAPQIISDTTYVPLRFISEALGADVEYSDGKDLSKPYIIPRIPHVMISRYDEGVLQLSKEECVEKVRTELIKAYENKYGKFEPLSELPDDFKWDDATGLREIITNLGVSQENDRYYVIPVIFDFWVDKYTGDIYMFYNGYAMNISEFDPSAPGALAFAG